MDHCANEVGELSKEFLTQRRRVAEEEKSERSGMSVRLGVRTMVHRSMLLCNRCAAGLISQFNTESGYSPFEMTTVTSSQPHDMRYW